MSTNHSKCPHCKGKGFLNNRFDASRNGLVLRERVVGDDVLMKALTGGGLLAAVVGQLVYIVDGFEMAVQVGLLAGSVASLGIWMLGVDFDGRGGEGKGELFDGRDGVGSKIVKTNGNKNLVSHRVEVSIEQKGQSHRWAFLELPVSSEEMCRISSAVFMKGGAFSRPWLCKNLRLISQKQYHDLRSVLLRFGMVEVVGNKTEPTAVGRALFRYYANMNIRKNFKDL